ncbi:hypothetical protein PoB_005312500 [Plakobranchus ocellatus]|uniref:IgGFc-binding protein N-terminal domain-containing protein n=1 Tax=Plakobranchus ocellatus TaxID=259542 RepID=A0AAV4C1T5_9GAST|nr:hypothetical protein PoB_005312500 [Plakobranchus ocellatus]
MDEHYDQVLPVSLVGSEYVTFPFLPLNSESFAVLTVVAVYNDTLITTNSSDSSSPTAYLANPGDKAELILPATSFNSVNGTKPFYLRSRLYVGSTVYIGCYVELPQEDRMHVFGVREDGGVMAAYVFGSGRGRVTCHVMGVTSRIEASNSVVTEQTFDAEAYMSYLEQASQWPNLPESPTTNMISESTMANVDFQATQKTTREEFIEQTTDLGVSIPSTSSEEPRPWVSQKSSVFDSTSFIPETTTAETVATETDAGRACFERSNITTVSNFTAEELQSLLQTTQAKLSPMRAMNPNTSHRVTSAPNSSHSVNTASDSNQCVL